MIDTAAGSSGFPVHTIFHVWKQILVDEGIAASHLFSLEDKPPRCQEYVEDKIFAIDFDVLMANPSFAGDIKVSQNATDLQQKATVKTGDVLISRSGTLGLSVVIPEYLNNAVYGSYFILTRPNQKVINPTYLALYLNSLVGRLQTEQANTGTVQTNLTTSVLESLLIVCPPLNVEIIGNIINIETITVGSSIQEVERFCKTYGSGRWKKLKGTGTIQLDDGTICEAELHGYEAHDIGKKEIKIKFILSE